jgi:hypothetical protein
MKHTQILTTDAEWQALKITQQADGRYVLMSGKTAVTTPNGQIIAHPHYELIALIKRDAVLWEGLDVTALRPYSLFCTHTDFVAQGHDMVATALDHILAMHEPLFRSVPGRRASRPAYHVAMCAAVANGGGAPFAPHGTWWPA